MERCPSGRRCLTRNQVWLIATVGSNPTLSAIEIKGLARFCAGLFCCVFFVSCGQLAGNRREFFRTLKAVKGLFSSDSLGRTGRFFSVLVVPFLVPLTWFDCVTFSKINDIIHIVLQPIADSCLKARFTADITESTVKNCQRPAGQSW